MDIYMAAVYSNSYMPGMNRFEKLSEHEQNLICQLNATGHILESYHYVGKQAFVDHMRNNGAKVFFDSGAFSAHTLKVELRIDDYVDYLVRNYDLIRCDGETLMASVLDGIGDAQETFDNQMRMEDLMRQKGWGRYRPLPCFHAGEPEHFLDYYVANYDYITLGGMVGVSSQQLMIWLDRMWEKHLTDGAGRPRLKVHGFGITAVPIMDAYPWYSCDSSSWIQSAAFGSIILPGASKKNLAMPLSVSEKSPSRHDKGQHATTLSPAECDYVFRLLEQQGFTYQRLSSIYESRAAYNLWAFTRINALINASRSETFRSRVQELI